MNFISSTARFDSARALSEDELHRMAPSIFAVEKHDSRSERFKPIPTIEILRALTKEGFMPVGVKQSNTRDASRREFTKHLIRLRRIEEDQNYRVGDTVCEILLKNANDGTSAYELMAGLFRICCLNSLVAQVGTVESTKVKHSGQVQHKVIEGTYTVLTEARNALAAPDQWSGIHLDVEERYALAEAAKIIRFGEDAPSNIKPADLLVPRRADDMKEDLWTVFNRVQENVIRGGLSYRTTNPDTNQVRWHRTRQINGIDQDVKLNRALWHLSHRMAELKGVTLGAA
jgi:hypothetical protein